MVLGAAIGWGLVVALAAGFLATFWDGVKNWLNNTAGNAVEKYLGYDARKYMQKAVSKVDKFMNKVRNRTVVFTKRNRLDTTISKITLEVEADPYKIDSRVLKKIEEDRELVEQFEYKG